MTNPTAELYVLRCPETGAIRYAGKANDAAKRFTKHIAESRRRVTPVYCWIKSLMERGLLPVMEVVEVVPHAEWQEREIALIARLRAQDDARLLNVADGGDGPSASQAQRKASGAKLNASLADDPFMAHLRNIKIQVSTFLRTAPKTEKYFEIRAKFKRAGQLRPDLFGVWANL